jgi:RNA polymerase sigma-70 factor (ECF subfamily)
MKLWFERHKIEPSKPVEAWLYTVAKNNILNKLRKIANDWKAIDFIQASLIHLFQSIMVAFCTSLNEKALPNFGRAL